MRSTEISRRSLISRLASGFLVPLLPQSVGATPTGRIYLSARADATGEFRVSGFWASGARAFDLPLPVRGHSFALHPRRPLAVHFARRSGRFGYVIDLERGLIVQEFGTSDSRHFYGHGVFGSDGKFLYASENDFEGERGVIGIYDALGDYSRVGEFSTHGIGPHDIRLLSDGNTLAVANGGILTRPEFPRVKLNLPTMAPSLCLIDRRDGALLRKLAFDRELHQLSIRHLAVGRDDTIAVAMQYQGPGGDLVPLVAVDRQKAELHPLEGPPGILRDLKQYSGSVCFDSSGEVIAVSAPRGDRITFWNAEARTFLSSTRLRDGSGVAPGVRAGEFLASSGAGGVVAIDALSNATRPVATDFLEAGKWDNHLVAAAGESGRKPGKQ